MSYFFKQLTLNTLKIYLLRFAKLVLKFLILWVIVSGTASANVALVIGNSKYLHTSALRNPSSDSETIAQAIRSRGFVVNKLTDASSSQMQQGIEQFFEQLARTKRGFLYFAGHGLQIDGKNYLVPVDFKNTDRQGIASNALSLQAILNRAAQISPDALVIVLDACRDDPFASQAVNNTLVKGLGEAGQVIPSGVTVVYGASAGQTALDDLGSTDRSKNGVFTRFFAQNLLRDDLTLQQIVRLTRDQVMQSAATVIAGDGKPHKQIPSFYDASKLEHSLFKANVNDAATSPSNNLSLHIIVPAAANGPTDFSVRIIANALQSRGLRVSLENIIDIPGTQVANLAYPHDPQRITLLISPFLASFNRHNVADHRLKPVSLLTETAMMLGASKNVGITNMQSLVRMLERRTLKIGTSGQSAPSAACAQVLQNQFGASKFSVQEFRGSAPAMVELIGGNIDLFCDVRTSFQPQVDAGRVAYVANLQEEAAPDALPATAQAQGFAVVVPNWAAAFVASDLPEAQVAQLVAAFRNVLNDPAVLQRFSQAAMRPVPKEKTGPEEVKMSLRLNAAMSK